MGQFRESYQASSSRDVNQSRFNESVRWDLRVPDLEHVWQSLSTYPAAEEFAEIGTGLFYKGKGDLPRGAKTFSEERFAGATRGFVRLEKNLALHSLPKLYWMNLGDTVLSRRRAGTTTDIPQILLNYAPVSRGPWRLKALIDRAGRPVASRFLPVRPYSCSLELLWALLNSPIANAYAFCHLGKRENTVSRMRRIPFPKGDDFAAIEDATTKYLEAARSKAASDELAVLMSRVDAEVLRVYAMPITQEQSLLSLFTNWQRVGVPFEQTRFLPEELEGKLHFADFADYETDWSAANRRRGELIDKDIAGKLSPSERTELNGLQKYADHYLEQVAPRPTDVLNKLEDFVLGKSGK
jgi:hypothetical protein